MKSLDLMWLHIMFGGVFSELYTISGSIYALFMAALLMCLGTLGYLTIFISFILDRYKK